MLEIREEGCEEDISGNDFVLDGEIGGVAREFPDSSDKLGEGSCKNMLSGHLSSHKDTEVDGRFDEFEAFPNKMDIGEVKFVEIRGGSSGQNAGLLPINAKARNGGKLVNDRKRGENGREGGRGDREIIGKGCQRSRSRRGGEGRRKKDE